MLSEKVVLITGGSKGLGKEFAVECAKNGATVIFTCSRDKESAESTLEILKEISSLAHTYFKVKCDDLAGNMEMAKEIHEKFSKIDCLINNAGISEFLPLALMDEDDWNKIIKTNVNGIYATTKALLPFMIRQKSGSILNISSLAGVRILAAPISYCASKASVKGFTESLCKEVGRYNIRVNCLAPGILEGGVADGIPESKVSSFVKQVSLGRTGTFNEVAKCATFLISDENSYMSGNTIVMDGGL